jgi:hypothetical protein
MAEYTQGITDESDPTRHVIELGGDRAHALCGRDVTDLAEPWPPSAELACPDCLELLQKELLAPEN